MNTTRKRLLALGTTFLILAASFVQTADSRIASAKIRPKKITLAAGSKRRLKQPGIRGRIKWGSSDKRIAKVNRNGLVTAKKAGSAIVTAKVKQTKYKWRIKVKKCHRKPASAILPPITPSPTHKPPETANPTPAITPPSTTSPPIMPPSLTPPLTPPAQTAKPVPTANPSGSAVTEEIAYEVLNSLRSTYPERMPLTNSYYYYSPRFGNGYGCYGFAAKLSDTVFGTEQQYRTHSSFERIRVGDHVRISSSHSVVVLTKNERDITVVEGNYNSSVHWDRKITAASLAADGFQVYTRY